jgi:hypothetical protein
MTAKQYIFKNLETLVNQFLEISFSYEYHPLSDTHFVHVRPLKDYTDNKKYQLAEVAFVDKFLDLYPTDSIAFVSDESLVTVSKPERVFAAPVKIKIEFDKSHCFTKEHIFQH